MTIRHIEIFLAVCSANNNITKASHKLCISQPSVSVAIQEIEKDYGILLFDRIGKRLFLTEAGQKFKDYALRISSIIDDMDKQLRNWDSFGILRIGSSITIGSQFMPIFVKEFASLHPYVDIRVSVEPSNLLEERLLRNEIDLAFVETPIHASSLVAVPFSDDELTIICSKDAPFKNNQVLSLEEFKQQKFLLREPGSGTREVFDQACKFAKIAVTPTWESTSNTALINATIKNLGIAIISKRLIHDALSSGNIKQLIVKELQLKRSFFIIQHKDKVLATLQKNFIEICKSSHL